MEDIIQLSDLSIIAQLNDVILVAVKTIDIKKENPKGIQYNLANKTFFIDDAQKFVKFTPMEEVDGNDKLVQNYYKELIFRKLPDEVIIKSLVEFTASI